MKPAKPLLGLFATFGLALAAMAVPTQAQTYPTKPIRFFMTAPAASSIDVIGRIIADKIKDPLGQPVMPITPVTPTLKLALSHPRRCISTPLGAYCPLA